MATVWDMPKFMRTWLLQRTMKAMEQEKNATSGTKPKSSNFYRPRSVKVGR